jgi:hypothetical protein
VNPGEMVATSLPVLSQGLTAGQVDRQAGQGIGKIDQGYWSVARDVLQSNTLFESGSPQ